MSDHHAARRRGGFVAGARTIGRPILWKLRAPIFKRRVRSFSLAQNRKEDLRMAECIVQCLNLEHEIHHTALKL